MLCSVEFAKLKLARIAKHLDEIDGIIRELVNIPNTYEILRNGDGKETIHFLIDAPTSIQIVAGEIVYQFKSILDQLAFALVQSNPRGIKLPKDWERNCQFPLLLSIPTCGNPPLQYPVPVPQAFFENTLPGISEAAYAFIESAQPYHWGPGIAGVHNILRVIGLLSNIDKHRHPYVLLPRAAVHYDFVYSSGYLGRSTDGGLKHGAEIPLPDEIPGDPAVNVKRSFTPYVTFDETIGEGPDTLGPDNLFQAYLEQYESVIIPEFDKLIQQGKVSG